MEVAMLDSPKELLDRIRLGEDGLLELKEVRLAGDRVVSPPRDTLADELAAFANGRGGVCVLGVEDGSGEILGIPRAKLDLVEAMAREVCIDSIKPPLAPFIERLELPASMGEMRAVLKIEVEHSLFVHKSPGGYFHRVGSSKREMQPDYLARLFQQRSQSRMIRFDEQTVASAAVEDLDSALWERFRSDRSDPDPRVFLGKLGLVRRDEGGEWRPTVAGVLMAAKDPREWLPNAFVQAVAYRGTEALPKSDHSPYQIDAADITGPLDVQVVEATRFIFKNMRVAATKVVGRHDQPQYHMGAVFEALVNAVAHRDYSIHGSKVRLRLFANRLEIYSPGALANTMDIDALPYRQSARNEVVTSLLARCPIPVDLEWLSTRRSTFMDRRGEGVRIILEESERLSGRRPEYRLFDEAELLLTVYATEGAPAHSE
jgi:predicted HTH transcriptional regulator